MKLKLRIILPLALLMSGFPYTVSMASPITLSITAGIPIVPPSGQAETIRATLTGGLTCEWISLPKVKGFDATVKCEHKMARVARIPVNETSFVRQFTFIIASTEAKYRARAHVVVREKGTISIAPALAPISTSPITPSTTTTIATTTVAATSQFSESPNWSGYVLPTSSPNTEVSAQWTVPTLNCVDLSNSDSSTWVGVGGVTWPTGGSSGALLQTGMNNNCVNGAQQESGWFELYPSIPNYSENFYNMPVSPGDSIFAEVYLSTTNSWVTVVEDRSTGLEGVFVVGVGWEVVSIATQEVVGTLQGIATGTSYSGGYSAEWIVEDVTNASTGSYYPFANYGSQTFSNLGTNLSSWSLPATDGYELVQGGVTLSVPSALSGDSFTCTYTGP